VNETGWNEQQRDLLGVGANWITRPLFMFTPLTIVITGTMLTPPLYSSRSPELYVEKVSDAAGELAALPIPSNAGMRTANPASSGAGNSGLFANSCR